MNIVQTTISIKNWYEKKETVKCVHDQLNIKKMRKHAVKKWAFAIRYDPDRYKTQQMWDKACSRT